MDYLKAVGPVGVGGCRWVTGDRTVTKPVGGRGKALEELTPTHRCLSSL